MTRRMERLPKEVSVRARLGPACQERKKPHQTWCSSVSGRRRKATTSTRHRGPSPSPRQLLQDGECCPCPSSETSETPLESRFPVQFFPKDEHARPMIDHCRLDQITPTTTTMIADDYFLRSTGPLRRSGDSGRKERPRAGLLPACQLQEHPRDRSGDQRHEAPEGPDLPRQRHQEDHGRPHAPVRRLHRSHCSG